MKTVLTTGIAGYDGSCSVELGLAIEAYGLEAVLEQKDAPASTDWISDHVRNDDHSKGIRHAGLYGRQHQ